MLLKLISSTRAAVDLASVMVGIIVIGIIGGIIAATIFAVIPWSQDRAAKAQLTEVATAEQAHAGMSAEDTDGYKYANKSLLATSGLLATFPNSCVTTTDNTTGYVAIVRSDSGSYFQTSSSDEQPISVPDDSACPIAESTETPNDPDANQDCDPAFAVCEAPADPDEQVNWDVKDPTLRALLLAQRHKPADGQLTMADAKAGNLTGMSPAYSASWGTTEDAPFGNCGYNITTFDGLQYASNIHSLPCLYTSNLKDAKGLDNISVINGTLNITDADTAGRVSGITDLAEFRNITTVGGDVIIGRRYDAKDLVGWDGLNKVGGQLTVNTGPTVHLSGFNGLESVGALTFHQNQSLTTIDGFNSLKSIGNNTITFRSNPNLAAVTGFANVPKGSVSITSSGSEFNATLPATLS